MNKGTSWTSACLYILQSSQLTVEVPHSTLTIGSLNLKPLCLSEQLHTACLFKKKACGWVLQTIWSLFRHAGKKRNIVYHILQCPVETVSVSVCLWFVCMTVRACPSSVFKTSTKVLYTSLSCHEDLLHRSHLPWSQPQFTFFLVCNMCISDFPCPVQVQKKLWH